MDAVRNEKLNLECRTHVLRRLAIAALLLVAGSHPPRATASGAATQCQRSSLRYNEVQMKASHNSYAANESLMDILVYHNVRSLELDLHSFRVGYLPFPTPDFWVFHEATSQIMGSCSTLSACLEILRGFHESAPMHEVVTVYVELYSDTPKEFDDLVRAYLGTAIETPRAFRKRCEAAQSLQDSVTEPTSRPGCSWPTLDELRGKFIFALTVGAPGYLSQRACDADDVTAFVVDNIASDDPKDYLTDPCYLFTNYQITNSTVGDARTYDSWAPDVFEARQANLVPRVYWLNTDGAWRKANAANAQMLATDTVDSEHYVERSSEHNAFWGVDDPNYLGPPRTNRFGFPFFGKGLFTDVYDLKSYQLGPETTEAMVEGLDLLTFTVSSGDMGDGTQDSFGFAYRRVDSDAAWSALVSSQSDDVNNWAKGCLMARASVAADAAYFAVCRPADRTRNDDEALFVGYRTITGASAGYQNFYGEDRHGKEDAAIVGFTSSTNGGTQCFQGWGSYDRLRWIPIGSPVCFPAGTLRLQGFAGSSHGEPNLVYRVVGLRGGEVPGQLGMKDDERLKEGQIFAAEDLTRTTIGNATSFSAVDRRTQDLPWPPLDCRHSVCGNGVRDAGEQCDDGNLQAGDGCSPTCQIEPDLDRDGIPDPNDWCVNVGGARDFLATARPKLTVSHINTDTIAGNESVSFSGQFQMPVGWSFAAFDPNKPEGDGSNGGVTPLVVNHIQSQRWSAILNGTYSGPGTYGWQKSGGTWTFFGNPAGYNGVTKMTITDRGSGWVQVSWTATNGRTLGPITATDIPLQATVIFGRFPGASQRGECGETAFNLSDCKWNTARNLVTCQK